MTDSISDIIGGTQTHGRAPSMLYRKLTNGVLQRNCDPCAHLINILVYLF